MYGTGGAVSGASRWGPSETEALEAAEDPVLAAVCPVDTTESLPTTLVCARRTHPSAGALLQQQVAHLRLEHVARRELVLVLAFRPARARPEPPVQPLLH